MCGVSPFSGWTRCVEMVGGRVDGGWGGETVDEGTTVLRGRGTGVVVNREREQLGMKVLWSALPRIGGAHRMVEMVKHIEKLIIKDQCPQGNAYDRRRCGCTFALLCLL